MSSFYLFYYIFDNFKTVALIRIAKHVHTHTHSHTQNGSSECLILISLMSCITPQSLSSWIIKHKNTVKNILFSGNEGRSVCFK